VEKGGRGKGGYKGGKKKPDEADGPFISSWHEREKRGGGGGGGGKKAKKKQKKCRHQLPTTFVILNIAKKERAKRKRKKKTRKALFSPTLQKDAKRKGGKASDIQHPSRTVLLKVACQAKQGRRKGKTKRRKERRKEARSAKIIFVYRNY